MGSTASIEQTPKRLRRLGRLRAVLRLGERADRRAPRRRVLAAARAAPATGRCSSSGAAPAASRCRSSRPARALVGIDLSAPMLARARRRLIRARLTDRALLVRGDIRHLPFRSRTRLRPGDGAVRHPAVADARARSRGHAARRWRACSGPAGSSARSRARPAAVERVPPPHQPEGPQGREDDRHARRIGASGSPAQAHDLRSGVRRAARAARGRSTASR